MGWWCISSLAVVVFVLAFCCYLLAIQHIGSKTTVRQVGPVIRFIHDRGLGRSKLLIRDPNSKLLMEFEKNLPGSVGTEFRMVVVERFCTSSQFVAAQDVLAQCDIAYEVVMDGVRKSRCLVVQCGPDEMHAIRAAKAVLMSGFGLDDNATIRVSQRGRFDISEMATRKRIGWHARNDPRKYGDASPIILLQGR